MSRERTSMKILLVDDSELFIDLEKSYLQRESFTTLVARSGEEALHSIRTQKPDLVILDLLMPGKDGDAVCREVKANPDTSGIPVIMVSSGSNPELEERCHAAGCDAFVTKPLKRYDLLETIERLIFIAKRRHPRIPTHILAYVSHDDTQVESWIHTISSGGLFLEIDPPPDPGERIDVVFPIPGIRGPVRATATVRWCGRVRTDGPFGVGVQFVQIGNEEQQAIKRHIEEKLVSVGSLEGFA
jgi:uncharacterized protein (TIGR02266 family)